MANSIMDEMPDKKAGNDSETDKLQCLNCRSDFFGRYCQNCGQDRRPFHRSIGNILGVAVEGLFDLDGKVLKSIFPILTSPGKLTEDFLNGRRRSQINPFQLYAFFSFLFFLTSSFIPSFFAEEEKSNQSKNDFNSKLNLVFSGDFSMDFGREKLTFSFDQEKNIRELASYDSIQAALPDEKRDGLWIHFLKRRTYFLAGKVTESKTRFFSDLFNNFKSNIPNSLIVLLPVFALLLKLLYFRRSFFFVDHLVFSIHQFCFLFVVGTLYFLFLPLRIDSILPWLFAGICLYFIIGMRRVYGQSWRKTSLKFLLAGFFYSLIGIFAMTLNLLYALFMQS